MYSKSVTNYVANCDFSIVLNHRDYNFYQNKAALVGVYSRFLSSCFDSLFPVLLLLYPSNDQKIKQKKKLFLAAFGCHYMPYAGHVLYLLGIYSALSKCIPKYIKHEKALTHHKYEGKAIPMFYPQKMKNSFY